MKLDSRVPSSSFAFPILLRGRQYIAIGEVLNCIIVCLVSSDMQFTSGKIAEEPSVISSWNFTKASLETSVKICSRRGYMMALRDPSVPNRSFKEPWIYHTSLHCTILGTLEYVILEIVSERVRPLLETSLTGVTTSYCVVILAIKILMSEKTTTDTRTMDVSLDIFSFFLECTYRE